MMVFKPAVLECFRLLSKVVAGVRSARNED